MGLTCDDHLGAQYQPALPFGWSQTSTGRHQMAGLSAGLLARCCGADPVYERPRPLPSRQSGYQARKKRWRG